MPKLTSYLPQFMEALKSQLEEDEKRWKDTWKKRPIEGQESRLRNKIKDYFDQNEHAGIPLPLLKIAGECLIAWVRLTQEDWKKP